MLTVRRRDPWLYALLALALALRLWDLGGSAYWSDEIATLHYARLAFWRLWGADTHPPLYYMLMHVWRLLGEGEATMRLSSVLVSTASVALLYRAGHLFGGRRVARLAALLLALSPFSIAYAQELRMYALLEFAGVLALAGLVTLIGRPGLAAGPWRGAGAAWWAYGGGALLALYTHNTGALLPVAATAALLLCLWQGGWAPALRRALARRWLLVNGLVLLAWLPYAPSFVKQGQRIVDAFWVRTPDLERLLADLSWLHFGTALRGSLPAWLLWPGALLLLLALALGLWRLARRRDRRGRNLAVLLLCLLVLPPALELLAGLIKPIFLTRTLIWSAPPTLLLIAAGSAWLLRRRWLRLLPPLLIAFRAVASLAVYQDQAKADWPGMTALLVERVRPGELLIVDPYFDHQVFAHYLARDFPGRAGFMVLPLMRWQLDQARALVASLPAERRLWFVQAERAHAVRDRAAFLAGARDCARLVESESRFGLRLEGYRLEGC